MSPKSTAHTLQFFQARNAELAAHLIAAAPELLEAARAMMRVLDATAGGWKGRVADECRAAIAKAEGQS